MCWGGWGFPSSVGGRGALIVDLHKIYMDRKQDVWVECMMNNRTRSLTLSKGVYGIIVSAKSLYTDYRNQHNSMSLYPIFDFSFAWIKEK